MNKIYRYRSFGKSYSLDDLRNDTITGITLDKMNDVYEGKFEYDSKRIINYIKNKGCFEILRNCTDDENIKKLSIEELVNYIGKHLKTCLPLSFLASCFAKDFNKTNMWGLYADNSRGYVLEYDYYEVKRKVEELSRYDPFKVTSIKEVDYDNKEEDYSKIIEIYIDYTVRMSRYKFLDILDIPVDGLANVLIMPEIAEKIAFKKDACWENEDEIRIITPNKNKTGNNLISTYNTIIKGITPTAVYVTERCSKYHLGRIKKIAQEKEIKVFKGRIDGGNGNLEMMFERIL